MAFIDTHFSNSDLGFLLPSLVLLLASLFLFFNQHQKLALVVLTGGALLLRLWMAYIDPFYNLWDEQFHALVAKHLMEHPFTPTLYETNYLPYSPSIWTTNHIWLHKPPLFLWQMALSGKLFGLSPFTIRLPSVVLTTVLVPVIYRMGTLLKNNETGFLAAVLYCTAYLPLNCVSGFLNTDQNDVVFMCYVTLSFGAWTEYVFRNNSRWWIWVGVFVGCAVLTKWLPGILVFGAWGVWMISNRERFVSRDLWMKFFGACFITILISGSWFLYAHLQWPVESKQALLSYSNHLSDAVEGHTGPWYFHFKFLYDEYDLLLILAIVLGFIQSLIVQKDRQRLIYFLIAVLAVYGFYSLVETRMELFCLPVAPLLLIFAALPLVFLCAKLKTHFHFFNVSIYLLLLFMLAYNSMRISRIEQLHTFREENTYRKSRINNASVFQKLAAQKTELNFDVVFNCGGYANGVHAMDVCKEPIIAYDGVPNETIYTDLLAKGVVMAFYDDGKLPAYIQKQKQVVFLSDEVMRTGF
jgi:4-amino-4-deoxy-L-arabinose transferase-like glycosyltransferase